MMWHFAEVWMMIVLMFVVGCLAGAHLYGLIAGSRVAFVQGAAADAVGDFLDFVKAKTGLGPAWRRGHLRNVDRVAPIQRTSIETPIAESVPAALAPNEGEVPEAVPAAETREAVTASLRALRRVFIPRPKLRARTTRAAPVASEAPPPKAQPPVLPPPVVPMRPAGVSAPRGGVPDNLQRIKGIGKRNEQMLNQLGIFHFGQIAAWTPAEVVWIGQYLAFPERIARDEWVKQAMLLAMGGETGFQKSAERRRERRKQQREFQERMTNASNAFDAEPELFDPANDESDDYDDAASEEMADVDEDTYDSDLDTELLDDESDPDNRR